MKIIAKPQIVDVTYKVIFKEPNFEKFNEDKRKEWAKHFLRSYGLRLNDLIFDLKSLSDNYLTFSKLYGTTYFRANIGLEEIEIQVNRVDSEKQLQELLEGIFPIVESELVAGQKFSIRQHLFLESNVREYLDSLNPNSPKKLEKFIDNKGVFYAIKIPEHEMTIQVTLLISLIREDMIFLNMDYTFSPAKITAPDTAFKVSRKYYDIITDALNLKVENEA